MSDLNVGRISANLQARQPLTATIGPGGILFNDWELTITEIPGGHRLTARRGSDVQYMDVLDGAGTEGGGFVSVEIAEIEGGHRVTFTDAEGEKSFDIMDGEPGSPGVHVGSDEPPEGVNVWVDPNGEPEPPVIADDTVSAETTWSSQKIQSEIEQVESISGKDGATFTPSVSPEGVISWTNDGGLENPAPVNIKGGPGEDGITPEIGENGNWYLGDTDTGKPSRGMPGEAGHTPVKGVDYFTEADKTAFVQDVLAALPDAEEEAF